MNGYRIRREFIRVNDRDRSIVMTFPTRGNAAGFARWWNEVGLLLFQEAEAERKEIEASN